MWSQLAQRKRRGETWARVGRARAWERSAGRIEGHVKQKKSDGCDAERREIGRVKEKVATWPPYPRLKPLSIYPSG